MMTAACYNIGSVRDYPAVSPKKPVEALLQIGKSNIIHPLLSYNSERNAGKIYSYYPRKSAAGTYFTIH
jgi:hypothetical protein